jgi:hypothetical protein
MTPARRESFPHLEMNRVKVLTLCAGGDIVSGQDGNKPFQCLFTCGKFAARWLRRSVASGVCGWDCTSLGVDLCRLELIAHRVTKTLEF